MAGIRRRSATAYLRRLAAGLTLTTVVLAAAGCARGTGTTTTTPPTGPERSLATTGADLSRLLVQPPGYLEIPADKLSGPIDRVRVGQVFVDHAGDADEIRRNGFVAGYTQTWKTPPPSSFDPAHPAIIDTSTVTSIILRFDTAEHARTVLAYFRTANVADGYSLFTVPGQLTDGYGIRQGPDNAGITTFGVAWGHGTYLLDVMVMTTDPAVVEQQPVALALAQDRALGSS